MSLGTDFVAFVLVAAWFYLFERVRQKRMNVPGLAICLAESALLTALAALWFGSVGTGSWWLVFLLLGMLVSGAERGLRSALLRSAKGPELAGWLAGVAKYVAAGGLLAWRLS